MTPLPVALAQQLPVDLLHWGVAVLPIVVLLVLLAVLRWTAPQAGPVGMLVAAAVALLVFQAPLATLAVAGAKGVWDSIFILYIVWSALLLYRIVDSAGGFHAIRAGIERFSRNELFLVLAFGWVFASFLQGVAGFGTPIAVVAPLLIGLGVRPLYAVIIPLIGHAWANTFSGLAISWLAILRVVDIQEPVAAAFETGILLWIPNVLGAFTICWLYGGFAAVRHAWPLVVILVVVQSGVQQGLLLVDPVLSNVVAVTVALALLYPLSMWRRYSEPAEGVEPRGIMQDGGEREAGREEREKEKKREPVMGLGMALMPYVVLAVATIAGLAVPQVAERLESAEWGPPFPGTGTGYGVGQEATGAYSPIAPFAHPGFFLLLACLVGYLVYRGRGYYRRWAEREEQDEGILAGTVANAIPASVAVVAFLAMSQLMDQTGQIRVLALGIAIVSPPLVYAFLANLIGVLGAFMTSSNTASNILFGPLQQETALELEALREPTIIAGQMAGGAVGNAIAPANVVLGTGTAGIVGKEGDVLRVTLPWALATATLVGLATVLLNGLNVLGGS